MIPYTRQYLKFEHIAMYMYTSCSHIHVHENTYFKSKLQFSSLECILWVFNWPSTLSVNTHTPETQREREKVFSYPVWSGASFVRHSIVHNIIHLFDINSLVLKPVCVQLLYILVVVGRTCNYVICSLSLTCLLQTCLIVQSWAILIILLWLYNLCKCCILYE